MRSRFLAVTAIAATAFVTTIPTSASAQPGGQAPVSRVLTTQVVQPFNLAVDRHALLVADGANATVSRIRSNGSLKTLAQGPQPGDVAGVAVSRSGGYVAYTSTEQIGEHENKNGSLNILGRYGTTSRVNLASYEERVNPDRRTAYGVHNPSTCAKEALEAATGEPASYQGLKDSHPYSVTAYDGRSWLVADAGGNDLLKVDRKGRISTVAVLPAQPLKITAAMASALELPDCVVGVTYKFEAVPTDVEVGGDGKVYVSTLAGGPESPVLGARSSVYQVNPRNGHVRRVATGFSGATNLALYRGKIYVAEFYAGRVSVIKDGRVQQTFPLPGVVSIESGRGHLYAGTFPSDSGPGSVVELTKRAGS